MLTRDHRHETNGSLFATVSLRESRPMRCCRCSTRRRSSEGTCDLAANHEAGLSVSCSLMMLLLLLDLGGSCFWSLVHCSGHEESLSWTRLGVEIPLMLRVVNYSLIQLETQWARRYRDSYQTRVRALGRAHDRARFRGRPCRGRNQLHRLGESMCRYVDANAAAPTSPLVECCDVSSPYASSPYLCFSLSHSGELSWALGDWNVSYAALCGPS